MTYSEKLKDPRWQKKRLEILERDGWACRHCGSSTTTLNVHHVVYHSKRNPWEYDQDELMALCDLCHTETERRIKCLRYWLAHNSGDSVFLFQIIDSLNAIFTAKEASTLIVPVGNILMRFLRGEARWKDAVMELQESVKKAAAKLI